MTNGQCLLAGWFVGVLIGFTVILIIKKIKLNNPFHKLFCCHKWHVHKEVVWYWGEDTNGTPDGIRQILICDNCGKIKKIEL